MAAAWFSHFQLGYDAVLKVDQSLCRRIGSGDGDMAWKNEQNREWEEMFGNSFYTVQIACIGDLH